MALQFDMPTVGGSEQAHELLTSAVLLYNNA